MISAQELCDKYKMNPVCGCHPPDGWVEMLDELCANLQKSGMDLSKVSQIKSKFGGLRFYVDAPQTEQQKALIEQAEILSLKLCTQCGKPGKLVTVKTDRWTSQDVRCEECK